MKFIKKWAVVLAVLFSIGLGLVFLYNTHPNRNNHKTVVIADTFTAAAYRRGAFYDYYCSHLPAHNSKSNGRFCEVHNVKCGKECLTIRVNEEDGDDVRNATPRTLYALRKSIDNLDVVTDGQISLDPGILGKYDRVILLHNEYVTKAEYNAITHHKKVIYLYPNAPYAEVKYEPANSTITLIRGHGYPDKSIGNGFGWKFDNTKEEYDRNCTDWSFHRLDNGIQLNCYPEYDVRDGSPILKDYKFWKMVRDYQSA